MRSDLSVRHARPLFRRFPYDFRILLTRRSIGSSPTIVHTGRNHVKRVRSACLVSTITSFGRANFYIRLNVPPRAKVYHIQYVCTRIAVTYRVPHDHSILIMSSHSFDVIRRSTLYIKRFLPVHRVRLSVPFNVNFYHSNHYFFHLPKLNKILRGVQSRVRTIFHNTFHDVNKRKSATHRRYNDETNGRISTHRLRKSSSLLFRVSHEHLPIIRLIPVQLVSPRRRVRLFIHGKGPIYNVYQNVIKGSSVCQAINIMF